MFNIFRKKQDQAVSLITAARVIAVETAINLGLDSGQCAQVADYAEIIIASGRVKTALHALKNAEIFAMRIVDPDNPCLERHSNIGLVPVHHFQRVNLRDLPQPPDAEEAV